TNKSVRCNTCVCSFVPQRHRATTSSARPGSSASTRTWSATASATARTAATRPPARNADVARSGWSWECPSPTWWWPTSPPAKRTNGLFRGRPCRVSCRVKPVPRDVPTLGRQRNQLGWLRTIQLREPLAAWRARRSHGQHNTTRWPRRRTDARTCKAVLKTDAALACIPSPARVQRRGHE
ncbi:hypothetical protein FOCC_FOCC009035, partial [Frankliniella occidentalis]